MTTSSEDYTAKILDFNIAGYNSARTELIERIKSRDLSIRLYLISISIMFSAFSFVRLNGLPSDLAIDIVFVVIGVLSIAMSQSVANHQIKIATIGYFIDHELVPIMRGASSKIEAIDWESCETNKRTSRLPRKLHYAYYYIIFLFPQIVSILASISINYNANKASSANYHVFFLVACIICFVASVVVLHISNATREKYNKSRKHD